MRRSHMKLAAIAAAIAGLGFTPQTVQANTNAPVTQETKNEQRQAKPGQAVEQRKNLYRHGVSGNPEGRFLNQRQYRKKCRQSPWMYKSKKHRSNN